MQHLEHKIHQATRSAGAPPALHELADVQDACRVARSASEACDNVQRGTSEVCDLCRRTFAEKHGRDPRNVTLPPELERRLTSM